MRSPRAILLFPCTAAFVLLLPLAQDMGAEATSSSAAATTGTVVQFIVYAEEQADVSRVFPGAYLDFTWNNVFIVSIWTNDPDRLASDVRDTLRAHEAEIQTLVPPYTMAAATQKWLEYNLIWVVLLMFVFIAGCACGGAMLSRCLSMQQQRQHHPHSNSHNHQARARKQWKF